MSDIKQVIVMRTDLGMRKGKMIAQGAHASIAFLTNLIRDNIDDWGEEGIRFPLIVENAIKLTPAQSEWIQGIFKKICVRVDSEQALLDIAEAANRTGVQCSLIQDAGLTEFGGVPTYTCLALGSDHAEKIDPITGDLNLL